MKAPVVGAGPADFFFVGGGGGGGGGQKHDVAQAGAVGMDFGPYDAAYQKKSEKQEVGQASEEVAVFRAMRAKVESLVDFILGKKNLHTQLKNMARSTNRALTELTKLRQSS